MGKPMNGFVIAFSLLLSLLIPITAEDFQLILLGLITIIRKQTMKSVNVLSKPMKYIKEV